LLYKDLHVVRDDSFEIEELEKMLSDAAKNNGAAIVEAVKKAVDEATKGLLKADEFATKLVDAGLNGEEIKKFMEAVEKQGEILRKMEVAGATRANARKSFGQVVIDALVKNKTLETKINKGEHRVIEIDDFDVTKVAGTMTTANVDAVGDNSIPYELADFERGLTRIQRRSPYLMSIANVSATAVRNTSNMFASSIVAAKTWKWKGLVFLLTPLVASSTFFLSSAYS